MKKTEEDFMEKNLKEKTLEKEDIFKKSFIGNKIPQNQNLGNFLKTINTENLQNCNTEYRYFYNCLKRNNLINNEENENLIKKYCNNEINLIYNCFKQFGKLI